MPGEERRCAGVRGGQGSRLQGLERSAAWRMWRQSWARARRGVTERARALGGAGRAGSGRGGAVRRRCMSRFARPGHPTPERRGPGAMARRGPWASSAPRLASNYVRTKKGKEGGREGGRERERERESEQGAGGVIGGEGGVGGARRRTGRHWGRCRRRATPSTGASPSRRRDVNGGGVGPKHVCQGNKGRGGFARRCVRVGAGRGGVCLGRVLAVVEPPPPRARKRACDRVRANACAPACLRAR